MRFKAAIPIALLSSLLAPPTALAGVQVTFINSYRYDFQSPASRDGMLDKIRKTLTELGARYLAADEVLQIDVLNIAPLDLATPVPGMRPSQMEIQYVLQRDGQTILQDRETLSDIDYVGKSTEHGPKNALGAQIEMLQHWFERRFGKPEHPQDTSG